MYPAMSRMKPSAELAEFDAKNSRIHSGSIAVIATLVAVVPTVASALRHGLGNWQPGHDAAATVVRARDVFSGHFPLIGMSSLAQLPDGSRLNFPGAWQLYFMAPFLKLFGNSWGTILAMASMIVVCTGVAAWLAYRRGGLQPTLIVLCGFAALQWTMGGTLLIDPTPAQAVITPFALFLVAVWAVSDGDFVALPVLAIIANYLVLAHLILTLLVPVIGLWAAVGLWESLRAQRRAEPQTSRIMRRSFAKWMGISVAAMVILWIPPIIDQFNGKGNLGRLFQARSQTENATITFGGAVDIIVSILTRPPFWMRDSYLTPHFGDRDASSTTWLLAVIIVAAIGGALYVAVKRRHVLAVKAVGLASLAIAAQIWSIMSAPVRRGFHPAYHHSMWVTAIFVWGAVGAAYCTLPRMHAKRLITGVFGLGLVVFSLLGIPPKNNSSYPITHSPDYNDNILGINAIVRENLTGTEMVKVRRFLKGRELVGSLSNVYTPNLILALSTVGTPFCINDSPLMVSQYGESQKCTSDEYPIVMVGVPRTKIPEGVEVVGVVHNDSDEQAYSRAKIDAIFKGWQTDNREATLSPSFKEFLQSQDDLPGSSSDAANAFISQLREPFGEIYLTVKLNGYRNYVRAHQIQDAFSLPPVALDGIDPRIVNKIYRINRGNVTVFKLPAESS